MSEHRIPRKNSAVRDLLVRASQAIAAEPNWPVTAPTQAEVDARIVSLSDVMERVNATQNQLSILLAEQRAEYTRARQCARRIDEVTDGLYSPGSPKKSAFGLRPKKHGGKRAGDLAQVVITKIGDGTAPASLFFDWDSVTHAAAYEVQWATDDGFTQDIGESVVSESKCIIPKLEPGRQYWVQVRAIRGAEHGRWSDPATRIANL